jgi:hypothetical protein
MSIVSHSPLCLCSGWCIRRCKPSLEFVVLDVSCSQSRRQQSYGLCGDAELRTGLPGRVSVNVPVRIAGYSGFGVVSECPPVPHFDSVSSLCRFAQRCGTLQQNVELNQVRVDVHSSPHVDAAACAHSVRLCASLHLLPALPVALCSLLVACHVLSVLASCSVCTAHVNECRVSISPWWSHASKRRTRT